MGNRYIHPEVVIEVDIPMKVKIVSLGDWSGIGVERTQEKWDELLSTGDIKKLIADSRAQQLLSVVELEDQDVFDRMIVEINMNTN